jgi:hypothetical protein
MFIFFMFILIFLVSTLILLFNNDFKQHYKVIKSWPDYSTRPKKKLLGILIIFKVIELCFGHG